MGNGDHQELIDELWEDADFDLADFYKELLSLMTRLLYVHVMGNVCG